jgi:ABC-type amino acid transport system permease subunit
LRRSRRRWVAAGAVGFIQFFRTTPEMILIFWGYYCLPLLLDWQISGFWTGSLVLGLVAAAYLAEIFRAGIEAIPRGQWEAARALGLHAYPLWRRVVLPQSLRLMVPPFVNYFTELVKNTTLLSAIGVGELSLQAYLLGGQTFRYVEFLTVIAFGYFLVIFPATVLARRLERGAAN